MLGQNRTREDWELQDIADASLETPSQAFFPDQLIPRDPAKWQRQKSFRDPTTSAGRQQLKKDFTRSGPVARVDTDPRSVQLSGLRSRWRLQGWRFGVFISLVAVTICLLAELVMLICAMTLNLPQGDKDGIGLLYVGNCAKVERINTLLAIPLNIIATVLVATSNYVMQCLSAPSRKEVDEAHAKGSFLNIGIPSVHNLLQKLSWNSFLWLTLVLTTVPIHLLLNSAFFGALQANNYGVAVAESTWGSRDYQSLGFGFFNSSEGESQVDNFASSIWDWEQLPQSRGDRIELLSRDDCFARYSTPLQSKASNVVVITKQQTGRYSILPPGPPRDSPLFEDGYVHPFKFFQLPEGVGLYFNPYSGNAEPILNQSHRWTSGITPQNTSRGLYLWSHDYIAGYGGNDEGAASLKSMFSSFDYHYWTVIKELQYDFNNSEILRAGQWGPTSWMCSTTDLLAGKTCTSGKKSKAPNPWLITPENFEVDHCLSQKTEEQCSLQYSFTILLIVIGCDVVKIIAMAITLFRVLEPRLATLGDAIASFLETPDPYTRGCCLMQQEQARQVCGRSPWRWRPFRSSAHHQYQHANRTFAEKLAPEAAVWKQKVTHWFSVPSKSRWAAFGILYVGLLAATITVLWIGVRDLRQMGINNPLNQGFGTLNPNAIFTYPVSFTTFGNNGTFSVAQTSQSKTLFANVITVNTPQLLFSTLYFMYNGMFTSMVTAAEWTRYASVRKALRVSKPRPGQRSTYWLQLPWRYSLPLLSISVFLHWLVSRSLFIVRIKVFGWDGTEQPERDISACGYSPLAILIVILILILSLVAMLGAGMQKLTPGIPMCGTNSVAIAAACHYSENGDPDISCQPLLWGVTELAQKDAPGHCSMSNEEVDKPIDGSRYT
ncbi:hypothetical protein H2200_002060 [Cladophialophora chaetospira]|uniref:DUF6536 domain-containing protein n=1 Tax=Cladophialophora chaetospira TaxID=386627 RepID=A0AA38XI92_9EURO|nr:hypothetical protein H2200_002060 [Cladophialophora chaetospira]